MNSKNILQWAVGLPCGVVSFLILMVCLWDYRAIVGATMLLLIFLVVGVYVRGQITEQNIRIYRFNHHQETPLDATGHPAILRPDMRETTQQFHCYQVPAPYQGQPRQ